MSRSKIVSLESLATLCQEARALGKRVVLCHGAFDLLHPGHVAHLEEAKSMGDVLAVTVTADSQILKGPGRPIQNQAQRATMLAALSCVDFVAVVEDSTAIPVLKAIRPDVFCRGPDYATRKEEGIWGQECQAARELGVNVRFTVAPALSSSAIINAHLSPLTPEAQTYLADFKRAHTASEVLGWLEKAQFCRTVVVGEAIIDEYITVAVEGKSTKSNLVTYSWKGGKRYDGGSYIIADHAQAVCATVKRVDNAQVDFTKRRYILESDGRKIFEVASSDHYERIEPVNPVSFKFFELVLIADFGHGLILPQEVGPLVKAAPFLALTVQANSLNYGYNLLTKWPRADYMVCDEDELRLAYRDRITDIAQLAIQERERLGARYVAVTMGKRGCLVCDKTGYVVAPAIGIKPVDTLGAGDAFLAVTSPLAWAGAPKEILTLVGSVTAAIKVGLEGNQPVERRTLQRWLKALLA